MYTPTISAKGFNRLNYYFIENIIEDFPQNMTKYASIDAWVYIILCKVQMETLETESNDIRELCNEIIYSLICDDIIEKPKPFTEAVNYIISRDFIQWLQK